MQQLHLPHLYYHPIYHKSINTASLFVDTSQIIFRIEKSSYRAYLFYTSHASYLETWNDDYAEPTLIYNNITDGLGLFGGIHRLEELFEIE